MANDIVWFHADEVGAPTLNNAAGSLIAVLDACLVSGFRAQTLTSVSVTANVATAVLAGHGYEAGKMVDLGGATPSGLNGRKLILTAASGSFTFAATGVASGAATGTITCKRSPLGWSKVATGTNKAIYARSDVTASTQVLRVDDTAAGVASAQFARVLMLEQWTDIDTYTGLAPTAAVLSGGQYWGKAANTIAAKKWLLVGDSKTFYLFTEFDSTAGYGSSTALVPYAFGDLLSFRSADAYRGFLLGHSGASQVLNFPLVSPSATAVPVSGGSSVLSRSASQIGAAVNLGVLGVGATPVGTAGPAYPSPVDNGVFLHSPVLVSEANTTFGNPLRGALPGLAFPFADVKAALFHKQVISNLTGSTHDFLGVCLATPSANNGSPATLFLDVTGPWQ